MTKPVAVYLILYALAGLALNFFAGFQQTHNDFWDIYFGVRYISLHDVHSLYSPYFPIGYYLFLKAIMGKLPPEIPAIIANIFFGCMVLASSAMLFRTLLNRTIAFFAMVLLSFFPRLFYYVNLGGADPLSLAFFALGTLIIIRRITSENHGRGRYFFIGGFFLGCGGMFRYHVLIGAFLLLGGLLIVYRRRWKEIILSCLGTVLAFSPQLLIYMLTAPHTVHFAVMNIYNLMYPLSWYHTITLSLPSSIFELIAHDPLLFAKNYAVGVSQHAIDFIPPLLAYSIVGDPRKKKLCAGIAIWSLAYSLFFGAMTSGRSLLLPLPLAFLCCGIFMETVFDVLKKKGRKATSSWVAIASVALLLSGFSIKNAMNISRRYKEHRACSSVEMYLRSLGCTNVRQVFSTDFYLYFRGMPPYLPYFNGGAPRWGTYRYNEEYPEFPDATLPEFAYACRDRKVRFVLLTQSCGLLSEALGSLYQNPGQSGEFMFRKEIDRFRIFEMAP